MADPQTAPDRTSMTGGASKGRLRWLICGLLFYATTVNYIDRQVIGILKPVISHELGWSEKQYGWVVAGFQLAYALMFPIAGRLIDWLGTRVGYAAAVFVWTCAAMSHALARNVWQFAAARFALGIGEASNFPAAIKTVAHWFPARERALATGIFNSGSNIGALIAPLFVPLVAARLGWRYAFIATGILDLIWIVLWLWLYRVPEEHPRITAAELALIEADQPLAEPKIPYSDLLRRAPAWAFIIGKFCTDPVWWFYLFWLPGYLNQKYGLDLVHLGPPLVVVYLGADVGSIGGGWLSSHLIHRGFAPTRARRIALFVCALGTLPVMTLMWVHSNLWLTVGLIALAASSHQGWSANLYTLVSDAFPRSSVASVTGLGGMAGAATGFFVAPLIAYWLDFSHETYGPLFLIASSMYVITFLVINMLLLRRSGSAVPTPGPRSSPLA